MSNKSEVSELELAIRYLETEELLEHATRRPLTQEEKAKLRDAIYRPERKQPTRETCAIPAACQVATAGASAATRL